VNKFGENERFEVSGTCMFLDINDTKAYLFNNMTTSEHIISSIVFAAPIVFSVAVAASGVAAAAMAPIAILPYILKLYGNDKDKPK